MSTIRVLLADDHTLFRAGIRRLLESIPEVEVVAEAADGHEALRLMKEHRPHVALMDITMPELNGIDATAHASEEFPEVRIIILSVHTNEEYVLRALRSGAVGYLLKSAKVDELKAAVKAAAAGNTYLAQAVSKHVIQDYVRRTQGEATGVEILTTRQREVLQLIAESHSSKEIADKLFLSEKTVEAHRTNLMQRLNIHDVAGLVRYAVRTGLVSVDE